MFCWAALARLTGLVSYTSGFLKRIFKVFFLQKCAQFLSVLSIILVRYIKKIKPLFDQCTAVVTVVP